MKKIKNILLIVTLVFSVTACFDDDAINIVEIADITDVTLNVASINSVTGEGAIVPFTAVIPNTFSSDVDVEVTLTFQGGIVTNTVTIPAGSTSADGTITMQDDDGFDDFDGRTVGLSITGLSVSGAVAGEPTVFDITSNTVNLTSYDRVQLERGFDPVNGQMTILFDWENPGANDLDVRIFNADTFTQVELAVSGSRWETDTFNDTHPDGDYFVLIEFFTASGNIPWQIFFVHPDQETISFFEGTFMSTASGDAVFPLINFTKTTTVVDGEDVVSYTFSQP